MVNQEETMEQKQQRITAQEIANKIAELTAQLNGLKKWASQLDYRLVMGEMANGTVVAELCKPFVIGASDNKL